jgi:hypothetical protein
MLDHTPSSSTSSRIQGLLSDCLSRVAKEHPNATQACYELASFLSEVCQSTKHDIATFGTEYNPATSQERIRLDPSPTPSLDAKTAPCASIADCRARNASRRYESPVVTSLRSIQAPYVPRNDYYRSHTIDKTNTALSTPITDYQSFLGAKYNPIRKPKSLSPTITESFAGSASPIKSPWAPTHQSVDFLYKLSPPQPDFKISPDPSETSGVEQETSRRKRIGDVDAKPSDYPISSDALPGDGGKCDGLSLGGSSPDSGGGEGGGGRGGLDLGDLGGDCVIQ